MFRQGAWTFVGNGAASVLSLIALSIIARGTGPDFFGRFAVAQSCVLLIGRLFDLQPWKWLIKFGSEAMEQELPGKIRVLLYLSTVLELATSVAAMAVCIGTMLVLRGMLLDSASAEIGLLYSLSVIATASGTPIAVLRLLDDFRGIAVCTVLGLLVRVLALAAAYAGAGPPLLFVGAFVLADLAQTSLLWLRAIRAVGPRAGVLRPPGARELWQEAKRIWKFVSFANAHSLIKTISRECDTLVVAGIVGAQSAGLYKVIKSLSAILSRFSDPLYQAIYPPLARLYARADAAGFFLLLRRSALIIAVFAGTTYLVIVTLSAELIAWTAGPLYGPAAPALPWYALGVLLSVIGFPLQPAMLAAGQVRKTFGILLVASSAYVATLVLLTRHLGLVGAGLAYAIYYLLWTAMTTAALPAIGRHMRGAQRE